MKFSKLLVLLGLAILFLSQNLISGEIEAKVTVDLQQIPQELRINVNSMQSDLERYLNSNNFLETEWEGPPIPVSVSIALTGGANNVYGARLFIGSSRHIYGQEGGTSLVFRFIDNEWRFEYGQGAMFSFNLNQFDRITSVINFYVFMIIGMDLDTYGPLDGNSAFQTARQIANMGASMGADGFKTTSQPGEFTRWNMVSEMTDPRFEDFRLLIFDYYVDGLDLMAEDRETALLNIADIIADMAEFKKTKTYGPSVLMETFFLAKFEELASTFNGYEDTEVFRNLIYLDPSNTQLYESASRGENTRR